MKFERKSGDKSGTKEKKEKYVMLNSSETAAAYEQVIRVH